MKIRRREAIAISIVLSGVLFIISATYIAVQIAEANGFIFQEPPGDDSRFGGLFFLLLIFSVGLSSGLLAFYYYFPEVRTRKHVTDAPDATATPMQVIKYVSTEEENAVIEAIHELSERTYQFEIARVSGLSRMKVHRVLKRLEERGIIRRESEGRGSRVFLAEWL